MNVEMVENDSRQLQSVFFVQLTVTWNTCAFVAVKFHTSFTFTADRQPSAQQESQLSKRDRATLRVIEYFAKSFKVTQGHSK